VTYSDFLDEFLNGLSQCLRWLKRQIFVDGNPFLSENLIFTIFAISIFLLLIEEILGLLTDFHFGGFILRRFGKSYGNGYDVKYETEYPKSYDVDYPSDFKTKSYRAGFRMKYFISYNGKYYPFRHSRYNPFYVRQFNSAYKAGRIVSANQLYGQKLGNVNSSSFGYSHSSSNSYNSSYSMKGRSTLAEKLGFKLGGFLGKLGKKGYENGKDLYDLTHDDFDYISPDIDEPSIGDILQSSFDKVDKSNEPYISEEERWLRSHPHDYDLAEYSYMKAMEEGDAFDTRDEND